MAKFPLIFAWERETFKPQCTPFKKNTLSIIQKIFHFFARQVLILIIPTLCFVRFEKSKTKRLTFEFINILNFIKLDIFIITKKKLYTVGSIKLGNRTTICSFTIHDMLGSYSIVLCTPLYKTSQYVILIFINKSFNMKSLI